MTRKLTFITPAFLCGAEQNKPEIRVPSIRGEWRWWFRVLGGSRELERQVFGGVHGEPVASKLVVRVGNVVVQPGETLNIPPMSDFGYLYYFAQVSGNKAGIHRTQRGSYFAPGTSFQLSVLERAPVPKNVRVTLDLAMDAFIRLGTLGLRATRGCGAMAEDPLLSRAEFVTWTQKLPRTVTVRLSSDVVYPDWKRCQESQGGFLKTLRKEHHISGKAESALGFNDGRKRESSALRLRPVQVREGFLPVIVYTDEACSQPSQLQTVVSATRALSA